MALNQTQISQVVSLGLNYASDVDNLDGLEYFTNLRDLVTYKMGLTALDVSKLTELRTLVCSDNPDLGHLDVSANTKLQELQCSNTGLSELDVTKNTELVTLICVYNDIAELDLSQNLKLKELDISVNDVISSIDNIASTELTSLVMEGCSNITELDVSRYTQLEHLNCYDTSISFLDVSQNTKLETLHCGGTQISELNLENNLVLCELGCSRLENLTEIDISKNTALTRLFLSAAKITKLDVSNQPLLSFLACNDTGITELDVSHNPKLNDLQCYGCGLTELDITNNPVLTALMCGNQYQFNPTTGTGPIDMILYLTEEQKQNLIDGNMEWDANNARVIPTIKGTAD